MDENNVNAETNKSNEFSDKEEARTVSPPPPNDTTSDFVEINNESSLSQSENQIKGLLDDSIGKNSTDDEDDAGPITPATTPTHNENDNDLLAKTNLITASTLVITTSQIIDDLNKSCVEIDEMDMNMNDSKASDDKKCETKGEVSAELNAVVDAAIVSVTTVTFDSTNDDDEDDVSQQTVINKTREENEEEPEQLELKNSTYEARNSIDVIVENQEEIIIKQQDETGLNKSCVDLNLDDYKTSEHNQTLDEFVQPSPDEEYGPKIDEIENKQHNQDANTNNDYSEGMTKSCIENGYQYVVNNNIESDVKSEEKNENNQNKVDSNEKEHMRLQNTSLDYETLEKEYEIPKMEQFVNLEKAEIDLKVNEISQGLNESITSQPKSVKAVKVRNLNEEIFEDILGSNSLQKKIIQYGDEDTDFRQSRPRNGQMCTISYKAFIKESNELVEDYENLSFILGDGDVMPAIDFVVCLMDRNEICEVISEARHAYGKLGKKLPPKTTASNTLFIEIPPETNLFLRIHLKEFTDVTNMNSMQPIERLSLAEAKKLRGNFYFNRQEFYMADNSYKKGLVYFNEENLTGEEEPSDVQKFLELRQALLMNLSLSTFKQGEFRLALNSLDQLLAAQSNHIKALFVKAKCLNHLGETREAIEFFTRCNELDKTNMDVKNELNKAQNKYKTQYENEKKMYQKMISGVSPKSKKEKLKTDSKAKNESSSYLTYVMAGVAFAALSIGVTMFAKYKNVF